MGGFYECYLSTRIQPPYAGVLYQRRETFDSAPVRSCCQSIYLKEFDMSKVKAHPLVEPSEETRFCRVINGIRKPTWITCEVFANDNCIGCTLNGPICGDELEIVLDVQNQVLTLGRPNGNVACSIVFSRWTADTLRSMRFAKILNPDSFVWKAFDLGESPETVDAAVSASI